MKWTEQLQKQIQEATSHRAISPELRKIANKLLEEGIKFRLVFKKRERKYYNILVDGELTTSFKAFMLKNYQSRHLKNIVERKSLI